MAKSKHNHGKKNNKKHGGNPPPPPPKEKVVVKKRGGCLLPLLVLLLIVLLVLWLLKHFGIGFFGEGGDSDSSGTSGSGTSSSIVVNDRQPPTEAPTETTTADNSEKIIDIAVSGNQYFYDNGKTEIEDFIKDIKGMDKDVIVQITDKNAYADDMNKLKDALEKENIHYTEISRDTDE